MLISIHHSSCICPKKCFSYMAVLTFCYLPVKTKQKNSIINNALFVCKIWSWTGHDAAAGGCAVSGLLTGADVRIPLVELHRPLPWPSPPPPPPFRATSSRPKWRVQYRPKKRQIVNCLRVFIFKLLLQKGGTLMFGPPWAVSQKSVPIMPRWANRCRLSYEKSVFCFLLLFLLECYMLKM